LEQHQVLVQQAELEQKKRFLRKQSMKSRTKRKTKLANVKEHRKQKYAICNTKKTYSLEDCEAVEMAPKGFWLIFES